MEHASDLREDRNRSSYADVAAGKDRLQELGAPIDDKLRLVVYWIRVA
jgi:hypothetical protein